MLSSLHSNMISLLMIGNLIPFIRYDVLECKKIGFVNRKGEVVVKPQYDMYSPGYKDDAGYIKVV